MEHRGGWQKLRLQNTILAADVDFGTSACVFRRLAEDARDAHGLLPPTGPTNMDTLTLYTFRAARNRERLA